MNSTAGSYVLLEAGGTVVGDAFVIKKLRDAGAIILAKASLDEVKSCSLPVHLLLWNSSDFL